TSWMVTVLPPGFGSGNAAAAGACPIGTTGSGTLALLALLAASQNLPSLNDVASHCSRCAASLPAFVFSFWIAIYTATPPTASPRLPNVPIPYCTIAVSPWITVTSFTLTPSSSAAICAKEVSSPCLCGEAPVRIVTLPVGSTRTVALSQPPAGIADDGPNAQISTYVDTPIPTSRPSLRAFFWSSRSLV